MSAEDDALRKVYELLGQAEGELGRMVIAQQILITRSEAYADNEVEDAHRNQALEEEPEVDALVGETLHDAVANLGELVRQTEPYLRTLTPKFRD